MYNCNRGEFPFVSPDGSVGDDQPLTPPPSVSLRLRRCNEPPMGCPLLLCSMGEFLCSFRCCSNLGGRCPALRLLLIPRRLTDIQSELVLYWKLRAGSGGLWAQRTGGVKKKKKKNIKVYG